MRNLKIYGKSFSLSIRGGEMIRIESGDDAFEIPSLALIGVLKKYLKTFNGESFDARPLDFLRDENNILNMSDVSINEAKFKAAKVKNNKPSMPKGF